jgi:hypothetical protein
MEAVKSTKCSSESSVTKMDLDLDFPVENFQSIPPTVSFELLVAHCEELREVFREGLSTEEERLARKVSKEFVL